jgi:hypothetical protein
VGDQAVAECLHPGAEIVGFGGELLDGLSEPVAEGNVAAAQRTHELVFVVSADAQRVSGVDHAHRKPQHSGCVWSAVDQVADEDRTAPAGVGGVDRPAVVVAVDDVAEFLEQGLEFCAAAVHVADHVEGPGFSAFVVEQRLDHDLGGLDLVGGVQHVHPPEPFLLQGFEGAAQFLALPADHVGAEVAVGPLGVACGAKAFGHREHDRHRQHVVLAGQLHDRLAGFALGVGGVDDGDPPGLEPFGRDIVQRVERRCRCRLVVFVVGDQAPEEVAGQYLGGGEVLGGER